jgi:hypothetical protein
MMSRLRVPKPLPGSRPFNRLASLSRKLASTGVDANTASYAELNSIAVDLYGLSSEQYSVVLDSFPLLPKTLRDTCFAAHGRATAARRTGIT